MQDRDLSGLRLYRRCAMLGAALALVPWALFPARADGQADDAASGQPQPGDRLVFLTGPKKGQAARSDDLEVGGPQAQVYPADPKGLVRDGSPLNLVLLARVGDGLDEQTRKLAADGVVAYSAICTHQACPVIQWSTEKKPWSAHAMAPPTIPRTARR